jgi:glutamate synthase (NADPH/NADH) small chain
MEFLAQQNRRNAGEQFDEEPILAEDKKVIVIGGGDTGSDCIGTSIRQGAQSVIQLEIMPKPPEKVNKLLVWPDWPNRLRTSSSQEEGARRMFSVSTTRINGENGRVTSISCVKVDDKFRPISGSEFELEADLVLLAMGFVHPVHEGMLEELELAKDERGNVRAREGEHMTSVEGVFAAGDMRRGQSLGVGAIHEGRRAARAIDEYLMGESLLPG